VRLRVVLISLTCLAATGCGKSTTVSVTVVAPSVSPATNLSPERVYRVPSGSMEPGLSIGAHVLVKPITSTPSVADIVVFHPPRDAEQEVCGPTPHVIKLGGAACAEPEPEPSVVKFIKRIVGAPGDTISIVEGHVIRNGIREQDSYIRACGSSPECNFPTPIKIPPDEWFMLGDNRGESDDSRFWGPVPTSWIIGVTQPCSVVGATCVVTK